MRSPTLLMILRREQEKALHAYSVVNRPRRAGASTLAEDMLDNIWKKLPSRWYLKHTKTGNSTPRPHLENRRINTLDIVLVNIRHSDFQPHCQVHRCEKINPSTGKPCNTVFPRAYDLTRHEDTLHSSRNQKTRCQICTEEKTFFRRDALTRHMRVVHPDVDFPEKEQMRVSPGHKKSAQLEGKFCDGIAEAWGSGWAWYATQPRSDTGSQS